MPAKKYTEQQKLAFLALIDRGGSVRAAALAAGVSPDRGYRWMKQAGLSTPRSTQRKHTPEDKAEFFRRLAVSGNVSAVARELGFNRVTCYAWAHKAGIFTGAYADAKRQEFLKLRREGVSRREAAQRLGVESHQALDWDKGIRVFSKGRIYPDGRVVLYRREEVLANVKNPRTAWVQGERVPIVRIEQVINARYLSLLERERLKDLMMTGLSIRKIAAMMGRAPSTISREVRRNTVSRSGYLPHTAHRVSVKRRERPRAAKLAVDGPLRDYVAAKLKKRWSPEQIRHRLQRDFPHDPGMRVSCETIYQAIYVHAHGELRRELAGSLRRGRSRRKPHRDPQTRTCRFIDEMTPISERPADVESRTIPGHWEGDLIVGAGSGSAVATLVERTTRYVLLGHLPIERTADAVRDSLVTALQGMPAALKKTLTWDQGAEMSEHRAFSLATDMAVYFCERASPWQRGTNENTNGLLRQYLPKGTNLRTHDAEDLAAIADELNDRPRKALGHPDGADECFTEPGIIHTVATTAGIQLAEGKLYLCAIKDVFSNKIVGYSIDSRMKSGLAVRALSNAVALRGDVAGCVIHSDRDSQFRSRKFLREISRHRVTGSMGRVGAAGDNAAMESFFSLLQKNVLNRRSWATRDELRIAIVTWIERTYHRRRRQPRLGRLTPVEFESMMTKPLALAA